VSDDDKQEGWLVGVLLIHRSAAKVMSVVRQLCLHSSNFVSIRLGGVLKDTIIRVLVCFPY